MLAMNPETRTDVTGDGAGDVSPEAISDPERRRDEERAKERVLITGVSGLIGQEVARQLRDEYTVIGLDVVENADGYEDELIRCDLTDRSSIDEALAGVRERHGGSIASVVHLAAYYDFAGEPSPLYEDLTVEGTRRLLDALGAFRVEQFVFTSSLLAVKPSDDGPLTEESPLQGEWEYPQSKIDAETVICAEHGSIPAVILRLAGVYDEDCHSPPISQQIHRIREKKLESYLFPGDEERGQSFVHLTDAARSICQAIERRAELHRFEVFLIGEENLVSYGELQDRIGELLHGQEWPTFRVPKFVAKAGAWVKEKLASEEEDKPFIRPWMIDLADAHYPVSARRARERLGWVPEHTLRASLTEMIRRLETDPARWYDINGIEVPEHVGGGDGRS